MNNFAKFIISLWRAIGKVDRSASVREFDDRAAFSQDDNSDVTGYQIAVGILGSLLGIILLTFIAVFGLKIYKK